MTKNNVIKQIVCIVSCIILLVFALVLSGDRPMVVVGSGSGTNEKITTIEQFADMFANLSKTSAKAISEDIEVKEETKENQYTSFSMHELSTASVNVSTSSSISISRILDLYYTENVTYYVADFTLLSSSKNSSSGNQNNDKSSTSISANIELYIGKDYSLLKYNKFLSSSTGANPIATDKILGKWFKFEDGDEFVESLTTVNSYNFAFFELLGNYLEQYSDQFDKSGEIYTLKDSAFRNFAASALRTYGTSMNLVDELSGKFTLNIENQTKPNITIALKDTYSTNGVGLSFKENDILEFKNINNTVIKEPKSIKTYTVEELENFIGG